MAVDLTISDSKQGALDALKMILQSRKQPLEVQPGGGGGKGASLQLPQNVKIRNGEGEVDGGDGESAEAKADRIARINDPSEIDQDLADIKQDTALRNAEIARKNAKRNAVDDLVNGVPGGGLGDFASFSADLFKAISSQVKQAKHKSDTYRRPNPSYAGTDYMMPGRDYLDKKSVPIIGVYFDQSGSWGNREIRRGIEAIACLHQFERQKKLKIKLFFFDDHLYDDIKDVKHNATHGFPEVLAHINNPANKITNAIVLSDSDIQSQTNWARCNEVTVPGCVWFLWKGGSRSRTAPKYLKGARGTFQYELT